MERQRLGDEIELKNVIKNFDIENIVDVDVWISLGDSDKITDVYIIIISNEDIADKDGLVSLASENLNFDSENIHIDYMDVENLTSREKVK